MLPRWFPCWPYVAALLLGAASARADVASRGERIVSSEAVFTGLRDLPAHRFVVAVIPLPPNGWRPSNQELPAPVAVRDGEPVATSTLFFQELRAIPADADEPLTDAWLASSGAPTSGFFGRHPRRVPIASTERTARARYHVRQIRAGWISLELLSVVSVLADGSEQPLATAIPRTYEIASIEAPPGWNLFLMPDPAWPRADPTLPVVPCAAGDVLPLSPGPRTLVAVQGAPGPDGSLGGRPYLTWGAHLDAWRREEVAPGSAAVVQREQLAVRVEPGRPLEESRRAPSTTTRRAARSTTRRRRFRSAPSGAEGGGPAAREARPR